MNDRISRDVRALSLRQVSSLDLKEKEREKKEQEEEEEDTVKGG